MLAVFAGTAALGRLRALRVAGKLTLRSWIQVISEQAKQLSARLRGGVKKLNQYIEERAQQAGKGNEGKKGKSKVPYGGSDLSQDAIRFRQKNNLWHDGNVAVYEYVDKSGNLVRRPFTTTPTSGKHTERIGWKTLDKEGIPPENIKRVYSELEPCELNGSNCKRELDTRFPNAEKSHSYDYPGSTAETREARQRAIEQRRTDFEKQKMINQQDLLGAITTHFGQSLVTKRPNPAVSSILSDSTQHILYTVGLPEFNECITFTPTDRFVIKYIGNQAHVIIGDCAGTPLYIKVDELEYVVLYNGGEAYVNSNVLAFLGSLYVCDQFNQHVKDGLYGEIRNNRSFYAQTLHKRLREIDPSIDERGYFWPGVVENIEFGLVY